MTSTPSISLLGDLYEHVTPEHAANWKEIGVRLGIPNGELNNIEAGWPTNVKWCCNKMWDKWLEIDKSASWNKIRTVIKPQGN